MSAASGSTVKLVERLTAWQVRDLKRKALAEAQISASAQAVCQWGNVTLRLLAQAVDQAMVDMFCSVTSFLRSGALTLAPSWRRVRVRAQQAALSHELECNSTGLDFGADGNPPAWERHMWKLEMMRSSGDRLGWGAQMELRWSRWGQ